MGGDRVLKWTQSPFSMNKKLPRHFSKKLLGEKSVSFEWLHLLIKFKGKSLQKQKKNNSLDWTGPFNHSDVLFLTFLLMNDVFSNVQDAYLYQ